MASAGVALYALVVGWAILSGRVAPERAYLLFAAPCFVPALWYLYGFLRADGQDKGLLLSSLGWFFVALTFVFKHFSSMAAASNGVLPEGGSDSPASWFFALLAVACLVGGAVVSGKYWMKRNAANNFA
ncbi:hypothetical protein [Abditibacterium utsteinense]|uniref:hypothetical protein n=1 Tax=Abditibacterium utsteinense TaxID=1960156 RepID=UPI000CFC6591|nr:hypothetical protein [Abditibacterium utsteinense]